MASIASLDAQSEDLVTGIRGMTGQMESRVKTLAIREKSFKERTEVAKDRILIARRKIQAMHEQRAAKVWFCFIY